MPRLHVASLICCFNASILVIWLSWNRTRYPLVSCASSKSSWILLSVALFRLYLDSTFNSFAFLLSELFKWIVFFSVVCFHWWVDCFFELNINNELCGCLLLHTTNCLTILWQWCLGNFFVLFQFIWNLLKCTNVPCYCCHYNFFVSFQFIRCIFKCPTSLCHSVPFCASAAKTTLLSSFHTFDTCRSAQPFCVTAVLCLLAILAILSMHIERRNHPLWSVICAVPRLFCSLLSLLSKCTAVQCYFLPRHRVCCSSSCCCL